MYKKFAVVNPEIATRRDLSQTDLRVLIALGSYVDRNNSCSISQGKQAARLGLARCTINRSIRRLKVLGLVDVLPPPGGPGKGRLSSYKINMESDIGNAP